MYIEDLETDNMTSLFPLFYTSTSIYLLCLYLL